MNRIVLLIPLLLLVLFRPTLAEEPGPAEIELFEKKVRPLLVQHCQKCHGETKQEAGLRVDTSAALRKGGDSGPSIDTEKLEESLLIEVVRYEGDIRMPPKGRLTDEEIEILVGWVQRGAPWPSEKAGPSPGRGEFDLQARKAAQWAFQPVRETPPPEVVDTAWGASPVDRFILSRLEAAGLKPAPRADKRTLLRRVTFDLTGLPPTPQELDAFLADDSPQALETVINRLLDSPHYGERWGRHWLDLVRFAETAGHEFDFEIANAWEYRDYVIRAFNSDLPYNQFVIEHLAGDLLPEPRRHPTERFNESMIGTAFWFLGESKHSPVDVRADEAERFDNQIDVFGKAFLGQTLGCARCHDHKFDALSTKDYYALSGYLQSSRRQMACLDDPAERQKIASRLVEIRERRVAIENSLGVASARRVVPQLAKLVQAAVEVLRPELDSGIPAVDAVASQEVVYEDFEKPTYERWTATGRAFGDGPNHRPLPEYQGEIGALGRGFVNSHSALARSGDRVATDELTGTLTSEPFTIERPWIHFLIGGGGHAGRTCLNLRIDDQISRTATGRNSNALEWQSFDVRDLVGRKARFEIVDQETGSWGNIGVDQITFSQNSVPGSLGHRAAGIARKHNLDATDVTLWAEYLKGPARRDAADPLHLFALLAERPGISAPGAVSAFRSEQLPPLTAPADGGALRFEEFRSESFDGWFAAGEAFGPGPLRSSRTSARGVVGWTPQTGIGLAHSGTLSNRLEGVLRSRTFTIEKNQIHYHAAGTGTKINLIVDSYQYLQNPIYGGLTIPLSSTSLQWHSQDVSKWVGHNAYIELIDAGDGFLAIDQIAFSDSGPPASGPNPTSIALLADSKIDSLPALARRFEELATTAFAQPTEIAPGTTAAPANLVCWVTSPAESNPLAAYRNVAEASAAEELQKLESERQSLESKIRYSRKALAMTDGTPEDDKVHLRGNANRFGDIVPRRFLEAVSGLDQPAPTVGSGRLEFARRVVDPANPLIARVIVNRLWKHHFGEGLVRTPDDFGNMGQPPTHPELLDYLASELVRGGWSLKQMHRQMLLTSTWQMSSQPSEPKAEEADPLNKLWHRANLRRLEAEIIRDAMLAVSGRLDRKMYGPPVMPYLTEFMIGRGRPNSSGPLDSDGRRSLYINVRRNFLTPMFLAFDFPVPFSTMGKRSVSNVPAQALALMNNPLVLQQSEVWARRIVAEKTDTPERLDAMFLAAFSRLPTNDERADALAFLEQAQKDHAGDSIRPWADLGHVLFNVKEFIFID